MDFLILLIFLALGWLVNHHQLMKSNSIQWTNKYVIFICLPAIIFLKIPFLDINHSVILPSIMSWLLIPLQAVLLIYLASKFHWKRDVLGCLLLVCCFGNTSFVGFPIIRAFLGEEALAYAVMYDQLGSFLGLAVIGNIIVAHYSSSDSETKRSSIFGRQVIEKVIKFPPFIALVFALLINKNIFNESVTDILYLVSLTLVPTTMFLVGFHFETKIPENLHQPLGWGLLCKMIIAPTFSILMMLVFQQNGLSSQVTLMESAMPPMVTASIMAIHANLAPRLAAAAVGYGLVVSVITMPGIYFLSYAVK